jgi:hypothetical protein
MVTSLDRVNPFAEKCVALVVNAQGCGLRSSRALTIETPVLLDELPGGCSTCGRVATCRPLGGDAKSFLIGVALYNHCNVWGVVDPPADWACGPEAKPYAATPVIQATAIAGRTKWPHNIFPARGEAHPKAK